MSWIEALVLGLIQGLSEYLPVSSSGHLEIASKLLGISEPENNITFAVTVHAATVLSTLIVLFSEVSKLARGLFTLKWNSEWQYASKILLSMAPVLIVVLLFRNVIERFFGGSLVVVGCCLLVTAALLALTFFVKPGEGRKITFWDALIIGVAQAVALLPGLSRSGATIATGVLLGNNKEEVAKFSFLMVIIPVLGETFLDILKYALNTSSTAVETTGIPFLSLAVGFLAAFISGLIACKWMINLVKKGKLIYFAVYCAIVGSLTLIFL